MESGKRRRGRSTTCHSLELQEAINLADWSGVDPEVVFGSPKEPKKRISLNVSHGGQTRGASIDQQQFLSASLLTYVILNMGYLPRCILFQR